MRWGGRGDAGTPGLRDSGTRGGGDFGTRGLGDGEKRGLGAVERENIVSGTCDVGTRGRDTNKTTPDFCAEFVTRNFLCSRELEKGIICWRVRQQTSS